MLLVLGVDVSRQKIYFASKINTATELRSLSMGGDEDIFDSRVDRRVHDEFVNGLFACRLIGCYNVAGPNSYLAGPRASVYTWHFENNYSIAMATNTRWTTSFILIYVAYKK